MSTATAEPQAHPLVVIEKQLEDRLPEFAKALPAHLPPERFKRVVLTAIQNNPGLMKVERRSFFNACMKAAQDGLLPDGRDGAIVEFNDKARGPIAQWMVMVGGLRKKVRNSGEIASWDVYVVFENDKFDYELGDAPFIQHKPAMEDRGKPIAAYSVACFKTGEKSREVMSIEEIEKVRQASRSKDNKFGPWVQWYEEMCRKTVARRHSKVLPMSSDLDDLIRRDDELYNRDERNPSAPFGKGSGAQEANPSARAQEEARRPKLAAMLDRIAAKASTDPIVAAAPPIEDAPQAEASTSAQPGGNPSTSAQSQVTVTADGEVIDHEPLVGPDHPDFQRGFEDAKKGIETCLNQAIKADEKRFAAWRAGLYAGQKAEGAAS